MRVFILFTLFLILSCKKKTIEKHYYESGEILSKVEVDSDGKNDGFLEHYYKTGELFGTGNYSKGKKDGVFKLFYKEGSVKAVENYSKGILIDTSKFFDKQGKILSIKYVAKNRVYQKNFNDGGFESFGEIVNKNKIGWWVQYSGAKVYKKIQYLIFEEDKKEFINQLIEYDLLNDSINYDNSFFYKLNVPDTIFKDKLCTGDIEISSNLKRHKNYHYKLFFKFQKNIDRIDSTLGDKNKNAKLWFKFKRLGNNVLKGYVKESAIVVTDEYKNKDSVNLSFIERKMFFEKSIYVKENRVENALN